MAIETYFPSRDGQGGTTSGHTTLGTGRLHIYESALDPENNTSTVTVSYEVRAYATAYDGKSGNFARSGSVTIDGVTKTLTGTKDVSSSQSWLEKWSDTWVIPHERNGAKTITISTDGGYCAGGPSIYLYSGGTRWANAVGKGTTTLELTKFDVAAPAYIGGAEYDIFIGNGAAFERYEPMIADGIEFK